MGGKKGHKFANGRIGTQTCTQWPQRQIHSKAGQQEKAWEIRPFECLGFACGVWQEKVDKNFLNRQSPFNVEGAQKVRTNDLKGESHQGLRRLVAKRAFQLFLNRTCRWVTQSTRGGLCSRARGTKRRH